LTFHPIFERGPFILGGETEKRKEEEEGHEDEEGFLPGLARKILGSFKVNKSGTTTTTSTTR